MCKATLKKFDSCYFVGTLSSWALATLSVRPPIRSSPPYTFSPGTSFSRASFPRAWSLINENEVSSLLLHRGSAVVFCYLRVMAAKWSHQWWCVVRTAVRDKLSLFTISSSCQKKPNTKQQMSSCSQQVHQESILNKWIIRKLLFKKTLLPASKWCRFAACLCDIKVNILRC